MNGLAEQYRRLVEGLVGQAQFDLAHHWSADSAVVWRVSARGGRYALKVHRISDKYAQEREAYERWLPGLEVFTLYAPSLVACFDAAPGALLTSWMDGDLVTRLSLTREQECALYEQAGRCLAELHRASVNPAVVAKHHDKVREKAARRAETLRTVLGSEVSNWALERLEAEGWDQIPVGYCHRDFSPRNWMARSRGDVWRLAVIDFEHAEVDYLPVDVMKLWDGPFMQRPERAGAFYQGYGVAAEDHVPALRLLAVTHGLGIVNWSLAMGDEHYLGHGKDFLVRCSRDDDWMKRHE